MKRKLKTLEQLKQIGWRDSEKTDGVRPPDGFSDLMWIVPNMVSSLGTEREFTLQKGSSNYGTWKDSDGYLWSPECFVPDDAAMNTIGQAINDDIKKNEQDIAKNGEPRIMGLSEQVGGSADNKEADGGFPCYSDRIREVQNQLESAANKPPESLKDGGPLKVESLQENKEVPPHYEDGFSAMRVRDMLPDGVKMLNLARHGKFKDKLDRLNGLLEAEHAVKKLFSQELERLYDEYEKNQMGSN